MDAPIATVDRAAFKDAFMKAIAKVADLYIDDLLEGVAVLVDYGTRAGATPADVAYANTRLGAMTDANAMLTDFFDSNANDMFRDLFAGAEEPIQPYVDEMAKHLEKAS